MIGAPSDIQDEIRIAKDVIRKWNTINSECRRQVLLPIHWSDNAYPIAGGHPQKSIDKIVVEKSDLLICIFCSRLGSPTDTHISGSIEEIDEHLKAEKDVMIFFKKNAPVPKTPNDMLQMKKLIEYKKSIQKSVLWWEYDNEKDFEKALREKLELYINDHWPVDQIPTEETNQIIIEKFSDFDKEHLIEWVNSDDGECWISSSKDGTTFQIDNNEYNINNGKERAEWDAFFERLLDMGYIAKDRVNRDGSTIYILKKAAYDYIEKISQRDNGNDK